MKRRTMLSASILSLSVAAAAAAGLAYAQPGPGGCEGPGMMRKAMHRWGDPAARAEHRLNWLKSDLKITAEQESLWQAFAETTRAEAGKGMLAMRDMAQQANLTAPERMSRMTEAMKQRVAAMESVNESFRRLYAALSAEQRKTADDHAYRLGAMRPRMGPRGGQPPAGAPMPPAPGG